MANEETGVIAEDTPLGESGPIDEGAQIVANPDEAKPDLDIPGKPEGEKAEPEAEKPEPKEVKLPWDKDRQKKDQEAANMRKRLDKAEHVIEELRAAQAPPSDEEKVLADAMTALEAMEAPAHPGEFAADEDQEAYQKALTKYNADHKKAVVKVKELTAKAKAAAAKPASPPKEDPEATEDESPTQADFDKMCREAEIEFGSEYGDVARPACIRELKKLGFTADNRPTKEQLGKIVTRMYRAAAAKAESGKSDAEQVQSRATTERLPSPQRRKNLPPGRVYMPTIEELGQQMKAAQARGQTRQP